MTYGEQIMRLRVALERTDIAIEIAPWLPPAGRAVRLTVTGNVPEVDMLKPYTGYETLRVDLNDPANWSWYGPGGKVEE
jgi:hypothetical protein